MCKSRMSINPLVLIAIALIAIGGVVGAVLLLNQGSGGGTSGTTTQPSTTPQGTQPTTKPSTTPPSAIDIEGPWHGTYTSNRGQGEWAARFLKQGNKYIGVMALRGPYNVSAMYVSITLNGDQISFGWAGGATFSGTVTGDTMSGTWSAPGGADGGTWSGERGETDFTPELPTTTTPPTTTPTTPTTTPSSTTTPSTTQTPPTTSTTTGNGSYYDAPEVPPPNDPAVQKIWGDLDEVLGQVYGDAKLIGYSGGFGAVYILQVALKNEFIDPAGELSQIQNLLQARGYTIIVANTTAIGYSLYAAVMVNNTPYVVTLQTNTTSQHIIGVTISIYTG